MGNRGSAEALLVPPAPGPAPAPPAPGAGSRRAWGRRMNQIWLRATEAASSAACRLSVGRLNFPLLC